MMPSDRLINAFETSGIARENASEATRSRSPLAGLTRSLPLVTMLVAGAQGCAFTDVTIRPPTLISVASESNVGRGRSVIVALPLHDARAERSRCGMQKNSANMDTASAICTVPPTVWLGDALVQGLRAAGFVVNTNSPNTANASTAQINGTLLRFFVEPAINTFSVALEADISIKLVVELPPNIRAERTFYIKGVHDTAMSLQESFQTAAENATLGVVRAMVAAIANLLDRYPEVRGEPAASGVATSRGRPEEVSQ